MSEKTTDTKEIEAIAIDENVLNVSQEIAKDLTFDKEGVGKPADGVYIAMAKKHDLDEDTIKKVRHFDEIFHAGAAHAAGMGSIPVFVENKDLESTKVSFKLTGRDKLVVATKRHTTTVNPQNREEVIHSYGNTTSVMHLSAGNKGASMYGNVYQHVRNAAAAALKDL